MIQSKVLRFHNDIQILVNEGSSYIDAILHWCDVNQHEIEAVAELINQDQTAKQKLEEEAEKLKFLKPKMRLPI